MKKLPLQGRTLALLAVVVPLLLLFIYVGLRSGPLAPVAVTVVEVQSRAITPALFGIGTVQARYTYKIGPTVAGRVKRLEVQVGDQVKAGQVLGEMEPVDLDDRVRSQDAAYKRSQAALTEAQARQAHAQTQARRYEQLLAVRSTSEEIVATKRQELQIAKHHAGNAWVLGHELDMAHEHRLQGRKGRLDALCGPVNSGQQTVCHPLHDGLPNGLFVRKVPKQRTLGQVHVLGDGRRGDLAGVL